MVTRRRRPLRAPRRRSAGEAGQVRGPASAAAGPAGLPDACRDAVLRERARIALELHDTVTHHMSVTLLQAEVALRKVPDLPDAARHALEAVRDAARAALTDTRRTVGVLRAGDAGTRPPGLDRLGELIGAARGVGMPVSSAVVGVPRPLSARVDLIAFRIVQESLSNAVRHAPGACVRVEIRYGSGSLTVAVHDDGAQGVSAASPGGGHGLAGMRERARTVGGTVKAGPRARTGWSVVADLPYTEPGSGDTSPPSDGSRAAGPPPPDLATAPRTGSELLSRPCRGGHRHRRGHARTDARAGRTRTDGTVSGPGAA